MYEINYFKNTHVYRELVTCVCVASDLGKHWLVRTFCALTDALNDAFLTFYVCMYVGEWV